MLTNQGRVQFLNLSISKKMSESDDAVKRKLIPCIRLFYIKNKQDCHVIDQHFIYLL